MSWSGPCRSISHSARPRMPVQTVGVSSDHMPVSETITASAASRSACCSTRARKCGEPDSSSPSIEQLEVHGGGGAAGGGEVGADAEGVEEHLALVVGRAARVEPAVADDRLEGVGVPAVLAGGGLHVVVAVDEDGGRVRVVGGPLGEDGGRAGGLPDLGGREAGLLELGGEPVGAAAYIAARGRAGRTRTGCAASRRGRRGRRRGAARCTYGRRCPRVWLMVTSLSARTDVLGVRFLTGRLLARAGAAPARRGRAGRRGGRPRRCGRTGTRP